MTGAPWPDVRAEHLTNVGFVEGPGNRNPWTEEIGAGDAAYCVSAATIVPHHHGIDWPDDVQFPPLGFAYCPFMVTWAVNHGLFEWDRSSSGAPAHAHEGDIYLWDWNFDGVADHAETAMEESDGSDGYFHGIEGYNAGSPEGCHYPITRPARYLLGVVHMCMWAYVGHEPPALPACPTTQPAQPNQNPYVPLSEDGQFGPQTTQALQWTLGMSQDGQQSIYFWSALQGFLGVAQDGQFGPQSTRALQAHLGVRQDGSWGAQTTRALQQRLNAGTF